MSDNIYQNNVYSKGVKMWHNKGIVGTGDESAIQVYSRMTPVEFRQEEFSITLNGVVTGSGDFGIIRKQDKEVVIGHTKGRYDIIQPEEYCQIFDRALSKPVETLGFLGTNAEKVFFTWNLPDIDVRGDMLNLYGFLIAGFDGKFGEHLYVTSTRVVCQNTANIGISNAENTNSHGYGQTRSGAVYNGKHNHANHRRDLEIWMSHLQETSEKNVEMIKGLFMNMQEKPLTVDEAFGLFQQVYPKKDELPENYPTKLRAEKEEEIEKYNKTQEESVELAMSLFEGAGIEISPDCWGGYNCVTELENHHRVVKKDATSSLLIGNRQKTMATALSLFGDYAKI